MHTRMDEYLCQHTCALVSHLLFFTVCVWGQYHACRVTDNKCDGGQTVGVMGDRQFVCMFFIFLQKFWK